MPISQNGQTHSNNSSANCLKVFDDFVGLALKVLKIQVKRKPVKIPSVGLLQVHFNMFFLALNWP